MTIDQSLSLGLRRSADAISLEVTAKDMVVNGVKCLGKTDVDHVNILLIDRECRHPISIEVYKKCPCTWRLFLKIGGSSSFGGSLRNMLALLCR